MSDNNHRELESLLEREKSKIDVTKMIESRLYTILAFAAFKNHQQCFKIIYSHGMRYNIAGGEEAKQAAASAD